VAPRNETVIVTGSSGFIGRRLVDELARRYRIIGLDLMEPSELPPDASFVPIDLTTEDGVRNSLQQVRERHGRRIASVIHLAAYFDLTGEPNPKYEEVTVRGTEREPAPPQPPEVPPQPEPPPPTPPPELPPAPPSEIPPGVPPEIPPSPEQPPVEIPEPEAKGGVRVRMTPAARRRAAELGLDPSGVRGTGPDGTVSLADVEGAASRGPVATPVQRAPRPGFDQAEMRKAIAAAMRAPSARSRTIT
jgi:pyruvate/2-oxoglutarate dehydrogenase complex dihydrolipoamide acyltransferase (E2) component